MPPEPAAQPQNLIARYGVNFVPVAATKAKRQGILAVDRFDPGACSAAPTPWLDGYACDKHADYLGLRTYRHAASLFVPECTRRSRMAGPQKTTTTPRRRAGSSRKKSRLIDPEPEMLQLPKNWFLLEMYKTLRKSVRGPISALDAGW